MIASADLDLTERAAERVRAIARRDGVSLGEQYLRVAVIPGGCSGLTYDLGWDTTRRDDDRVIEHEELRVLLDRKSYLYVQGTTLDFSDGLEGQGFHFHNPQASRTCACGESFSL